MFVIIFFHFQRTNEIVHKTLRNYTVRAKQGGGQSSYDSQCGGLGGVKSAGANLRRHGEATIRNVIIVNNYYCVTVSHTHFLVIMMISI